MPPKTFTITVDLDTLMIEFIPKLARQFMSWRGTAGLFEGTVVTLTMDVSGSRYSYTVTDGREFEALQGDLDNPMVLLELPLEDMARLAEMPNIDMLLGMQRQLTLEKYQVLAGLQGTCRYQLIHPNGEKTIITAVFSGAQKPFASFTLDLEDARELTAGHESPIQQITSERLQVEGDMAFAMKVQSLFS